jgi:hypothetical protein
MTSDKLPRREQYSAGDIAFLYGVSHRTAVRMIDSGTIPGHTIPGSRVRRVLHADLVGHVNGADGKLDYVLEKIS